MIEFDRWLEDKKAKTPGNKHEEYHRVGVGIYFFEHNKEEGESHENQEEDRS